MADLVWFVMKESYISRMLEKTVFYATASSSCR